MRDLFSLNGTFLWRRGTVTNLTPLEPVEIVVGDWIGFGVNPLELLLNEDPGSYTQTPIALHSFSFFISRFLCLCFRFSC